MESIQSRVESWFRGQRARFLRVSWGPLQWRFRWPPWNGEDADQRIKIRGEYEKRKKQIQDLCLALKSESVEGLQDLLCCMVLSECVYKELILEPRLSKVVPLEAVRKQLDRYRGKKADPAESCTANDSLVSAPIEDVVIEPQSLEIEEGRDGQTVNGKSEGKTDSSNGFGNSWRGVPS